MNKNAKLQRNFCCSFSRVSRYSLIGLLGVILLSDAVGAKVGGLENYSPKRSPEILLDKYRDNFPSLETGDKQVLLKNYHNQREIYLAQQSAPTPSIPLNTEQQKLYEQGVKLFQEAQELKKKGNREGYDQAINKYQQALKIVQSIGLRQEEAEINQNIGVVYFLLSDYKNALESHKKALSIWQELNQPLQQASALSLIGNVYVGIGEHEKAIEYFNQAESSFRAQKQFGFVAITLNSASNAYMRLGQMKNALNSLNQAIEIYRTTFIDIDKEAYILDRIAFVYSQISESDTAFQYYNQALDIQRKRRDFPAQAIIMRHIGSLHLKLGKHQQALEFLNKALEIQQTKGTLIDQGLIIQDIADVHISLGAYNQGIEEYKKAKSLFHQAGLTSLESQAIGLIVSVYRSFLGDNQKALKYTNEALQLQRQGGDKEDEASTLNQQADIYLLQGDYQIALDLYNQALKIERFITKNPRAEARTLGNIALLYNSLGDPNSSIKTYNQALDIYTKLDNQSEQARIMRAIGNVYQLDGRYNEAFKYYNQALSLYQRQKDHQLEIATLWGIAKTHRSSKDYDKAFDAANQALVLSQQYQYSFEQTASLGIIGSVYFAQGDYQNALNSYKNILVDYRKAGLRIKEAETLNTMSMAYEFQKNYNQAIDRLNEELKLRRELKDKTGEAQALYQIAINQRNLGNLEAALSNIQTTINIVESIRGNVQSDELRTSYFATVQNYYKFYIDLLMQLHEKDPTKVCELNIQYFKINDRCDAVALHISERARARSLVELLTEANAKIRKGANPELIQQERDLLQKLDTKQKLLQDLESRSQKDPVTEASIKRCQKDIENLLSQYRELQTKIRTTSPKYAALKYPEPLKLDQIQQQLDKDTILLQYSLGEQRSYVWVVTPNSLHSYELPKRKLIETAALDLKAGLQDIANQGTSPDNIPLAGKKISITQAANQLSELIIAPVTKHLGQKRLVVVADGVLQYIPFAALTIPQSSISQKNYQPLLLNHEIVNLPSASTIDILRKEIKERKAPKTLAVLADPVFSKQDERLANNCQNPQPFLSNNAQQLAINPQNSSYNIELDLEKSALIRATRDINWDNITRLKKTRTEALEIMKFVDDSEQIHAFDCEANYAWASNPELSQYRYLLFATHGILNDINPELSGIVLSLVDKNGNPTQKPFLQLSDLFNLDYPAELIVLSACETGLGKEVSGEGLVGLTRGLMYAGAARVAVSLWSVEEEATSKLMREFYREILQNGKTPAAALRAAQLEMWRQEEWRNPYSWAGFTLLGEWR
ncbi:tetratricopeptide repeat protein [Nostoc sp. CHAB 5834]|nr:tetratricopeptide repeat protein [Nostoc sp. CHAB 5834]